MLENQEEYYQLEDASGTRIYHPKKSKTARKIFNKMTRMKKITQESPMTEEESEDSEETAPGFSEYFTNEMSPIDVGGIMPENEEMEEEDNKEDSEKAR